MTESAKMPRASSAPGSAEPPFAGGKTPQATMGRATPIGAPVLSQPTSSVSGSFAAWM